MRRRIIHVQLHTINLPSHIFEEGEFIDVMPRHSLPMSTADELADILRVDLKTNTAQWLRELFKCQIVKWHLNMTDEEDKKVEMLLPKDADDYEKLLDRGVLLLFASIVSQLKVGDEDIVTEWGTFSIASDGTCSMVAPLDSDEKKSP